MNEGGGCEHKRRGSPNSRPTLNPPSEVPNSSGAPAFTMLIGSGSLSSFFTWPFRLWSKFIGIMAAKEGALSQGPLLLLLSRLVLSPRLPREHLTYQDPAGHQQGARAYRKQGAHRYHPLLAADDCWMVFEHSTPCWGAKVTSMPPGSKSSASLPYCRKLEAFWKLPVLPNWIAGAHWLA